MPLLRDNDSVPARAIITIARQIQRSIDLLSARELKKR